MRWPEVVEHIAARLIWPGEGLARALFAEQDRWVLWTPVLFGAGAAVYLALLAEPSGALVLALAILAGMLTWLSRWRPFAFVFAAACLCVAVGFAIAKARTEAVRAPVLPQQQRAYDFSGWIEEREHRHGGDTRLTLRVLSISPDETGAPYRVRITLRGGRADGFLVGEAVTLRAVLRGPPGPVMPGGYDFARAAYFERIGGMGFAIGPITRLASAPTQPLSLTLAIPIERLRAAIGQRIRAAVPGERGDIASALINGDRAGLSEETNEALRNSGLYHVISISGLHMVIMTASLFWLVRALLALSPTLAIQFPIKKIAAVVALAGALFYLLLSGASLPTQRAWIMISIAFIAVLLDRPAISQRTVALSALFILILRPESIADVSFQMSFAAVVALVAFYEWLRERRKTAGEPPRSLAIRITRAGLLFVFGAALTTLVAGTAVTPFSIHHFQNAQHFAVVANVLASPVITGLIMPTALLSLLVMPLGLEALPLHLMALGIDLMLGIARMVGSWPGAISTVPKTPVLTLVLITLGGLWLCLWRHPMRYGGIAAIAAGIVLSPLAPRPDVLIDREGKIVAARDSHGLLSPSPVRASNYTVGRWLASDGDGRETELAVKNAAAVQSCDDRGCLARIGERRISLIRHPAALEDDCRIADVVVAPFPVTRFCHAPLVIDGRKLRAEGAHALYVEEGSMRIETAAALRGNRPWVNRSEQRPSAVAQPQQSQEPPMASAKRAPVVNSGG